MLDFIRKRCEQVILSALNEISSAIYLIDTDMSDFEVGAWTPLNINHENPIIKYAAISACKNPADPFKTFVDEFGLEVTRELEECFFKFYPLNPVKSHNTAIAYAIEMTRLKTFVEVMYQAGGDAEVLAKWLIIDPTGIAANDWR